ncbi:MAG: 50S ribosomal protein L28 [Elusimicrobia bacterium]|nr:50S ribosomal protein L28 [Elusimicrobiota bacterium]
MAFRCALCEKGPVAGNSYSHSHKAVRRIFRPNLQRQKLVLDGRVCTAYVCSDCIKSGRVVRPSFESQIGVS